MGQLLRWVRGQMEELECLGPLSGEGGQPENIRYTHHMPGEREGTCNVDLQCAGITAPFGLCSFPAFTSSITLVHDHKQ